MEKQFLINLLKKSLVMVGFTYFSVAVATQTFTTITPAIISGGAYFFTEAARYYNLKAGNQEAKRKHKKSKIFTFLI